MNRISFFVWATLLSALFMAGNGCQPRAQDPTPAVTEETRLLVEKYLDEKPLQPSFGGKIYSAHKIFLVKENRIYLWAYMQEYYHDGQEMKTGTGWSVPMVLNTSGTGITFSILSHAVPADGEDFSRDVRKMFPAELHTLIFDFPGTPEMKPLEEHARKRAAAEMSQRPL